jgi:hypothetical protein
MGTLQDLGFQMAGSFQKLNLEQRHDFRKEAYERLTGLPYRDKNPRDKESQIQAKKSQIRM